MHIRDRVNVIMPIYNEEKTAYKMIKRVLKQDVVDRLIIVYRISEDNTYNEIKRAIIGCTKCTLLINRTKRGKGYSVRMGIKNAKRGIVIIQDADEEYYPEDYKNLLNALSEDSPVFGYRTVNYGHGYALGIFANRVHTLLFNLLFHQSVKDINTGYKVFEIGMLKNKILKENGWELDAEIATTLAKNGYKIKNVPIRYKGRTYDEGKKIGPKAAINFIFFIIKQRIRN